ncbi:MAG: hypothetical protein WD512_04085 [Candidatus Paceibacterota bacterium]
MQEKTQCKCEKCKKEKISKLAHPISRKIGKHLEITPKKNKECKTNCSESIDVKVDILPEVLLKQLNNNNRTTFEIELDVAAMPNCRVVKKEVFDPVSCRSITKYVLLVESDVKLDCTPVIKQISPKPSAKYEMDVIVDTKQNITMK